MTYANVTQPSILNRGFTFHEHIDEFKLINMNGRVYDPVLGRFIQPDNFVQDPSNLQNFNRYAYVYNNPLQYTDPSGNFAAIPLMAMGTAVIGISNLIEGGHSNPFGDAYKEMREEFANVKNILSFQTNGVTVGLDPFGMSVYMGFQTSVGNVDYGVNIGLGFGGPTINGNVGVNIGDSRIGIGGGLFSNGYSYGGSVTYNGYGVQYYQTVYGGSADNPTMKSNPQKIGGVGILFPRGSIKVENDFLAGTGDKWRSQALEVTVDNFSIGSRIYNNDPEGEGLGEDKNGRDLRGNLNKHNKSAWINGLTYLSPVWVGYNAGGGVARIGYSHPIVQDLQQNVVHLYFPPGYQHFYNKYTSSSKGIFMQSGYNNPYSLYGK